jgi:hypothetical protein
LEEDVWKIFWIHAVVLGEQDRLKSNGTYC